MNRWFTVLYVVDSYLKANNESLAFAHKEMITRGTDDEGGNFHLIHVDAGKVHGMHVV